MKSDIAIIFFPASSFSACTSRRFVRTELTVGRT